MKNIKLYITALKKCKDKNMGDFMCKVLERMNGLSPEDILKMCGQYDNVPVDLDEVIRSLQVIKKAAPLEDVAKATKRSHIAGLVVLNGDNVGIFYNVNDSIKQKRFTIAHEIGHCCLHGDILKNGYIEFLHKDGFENEHEIEASVFASKLLIPAETLREIYNRLILPSLSGLADIFGVPIHIMEHRLKELKMKYYIDEKDKFVEP